MSLTAAAKHRQWAEQRYDEGNRETAWHELLAAFDELMASVEQAWTAINTINAERSAAGTSGGYCGPGCDR